MTAGEPPPARAGAPVVVAADEQGEVVLDANRLGDLAASVLVAEGVEGPAELALTFVDEGAMANLNARYLDGEGPTDVLAFPLDEPGAGRFGDAPVLLGDVVVCPSVARRYAERNGRSLDDELALLVVHGVLHVLGHDHAEAEEAAAMRAAEHRHLTTLVDPSWTWSTS